MRNTYSPYFILSQMEGRCRDLAAGLPAQQEMVRSWSGIGFRMGTQLFVAPMGEINEILHEPRYTQLPGVKPWVKGVANVRGRLLPLMDLNVFLGGESSSSRLKRRILVVDVDDIFAGLIVDEVLGMQYFPNASFSELPATSADSLQPFIHGAFTRESEWLVFSPHALVRHQQFLSVAA
ncbi:twitching motility protein PilI [Pseudomonas duriflava]|uniref:Twitching motility protein PilI n=1 Tax=Pseudomonas duriflava TaxID=459528 RepID=A0A562QNT2_9PSED|nr:chemotaxis protein CheW [Pseudomonas duriflava]TWI58409.1 twitching motility protein PilI [Pseudomonas duriflava]